MMPRAAGLTNTGLVIVSAKEPACEGAKNGPDDKSQKDHFAGDSPDRLHSRHISSACGSIDCDSRPVEEGKKPCRESSDCRWPLCHELIARGWPAGSTGSDPRRAFSFVPTVAKP